MASLSLESRVAGHCRLRRLLLAPLLLLLLFALYGGILSGGFVVDDQLGPARSPPLFDLAALIESAGGWGFSSTELKAGETPFFRPVGVVVSALLHQLLDNDPRWWHLLSLLFHLINALLVARIASLLIPEAGWRLAWVSGALFAAHPAAAEAFLWVSSHNELIAVMLVLLLVERLLVWRPRLDRWRIAVIGLLFALAILTKEVALSMAVIVPGWMLLSAIDRRRGGGGAGLPLSLPLLALLPLLSLGYLVWRSSVIGDLAGERLLVPDPARIGELLLVHLRYLFLPDYPPFALAPPESALTPHSLLLMALLVMVALFALAWRRDLRLRGALLLLWLPLALWPAAAIALVGDGFYAARHAYLATAVPALLLPLVWLRIAGWQRWLASGLLLAWLLPVWSGAPAVAARWGDNLLVYRQAARVSPSAPGPQAGMAAEYAKRGEWRQAVNHYLAAFERGGMAGERALYLYQIALLEAENGSMDLAFRWLRQAVELDPVNDDLWTGLGNVAWIQGRTAEAVTLYRRALALDPQNREARINLDRLTGQMAPGGGR